MMQPRVVADGSHSLIIFAQGRKYLHAVAMGDTIRIVSVLLSKSDHLRPVRLKNKPYPVKKAVRTYLRSELRKTKRAGKVLRQLLKSKEVG